MTTQREELMQRRATYLGPAYRLFYHQPKHFVRGENVWLYDVNGKRYLDAYNNVASVGHCHPAVVAALAAQAAQLNTHTRYLHENVVDYAEKLLSTFPAALGNVMFTCTGSEANDLALRIATSTTRGQGIIVTRNAYHGVTAALANISPSLDQRAALPPHVRVVDAPDSYRKSPAQAQADFTRDVQLAVLDLRQHAIPPAALIVDTLFASDGIYPHPIGLLQGAVDAIHAAGGLFIADEVQAGLARLGSHMWGFQRHGVLPDLVTVGKPMGDGHPIAAMIARPHLLQEFGARTRYFNTFAGNPVSAAVGLAVLNVIDDQRLQDNARTTGAYLLHGLRELAAEHEQIGDVRGAGLYAAVEIVSDKSAKSADGATAAAIVNTLSDNGVLVGLCGQSAQVIKIRPPLTFNQAHADQLLTILRQTLRNL
ncbi:aspartate aminotransferase family protein [Brenneria goodwinii]|uniref:Putative aminotransferase n=1 Tax=Brenneria goodwinii TaxID=1109412 RepID=A0A0G4JPZ2_9GAMM|nr:aspartate aminotransferase family protein [Brenneria goodwinii]MCG8155518.1 aspartate aminotransferase family protein [Brenneria goodwinii]MCG8160455.1 aspartate aminotransferase family protein [Brenneria goodwinii]MCG8164978.1 aspartate aminotransferase family protein [Brenneria goodwinii]MCG8169365.1 aspartate aminotransferase family protein [Brenneria goodwinii]MCG8174539.1 aspartate aminotransferase family protein [Brenneria goodwinii]